VRRRGLGLIALVCVAASVASACSSHVPPGQFFGDGRANAQEEVPQNGGTTQTYASAGVLGTAAPGATLAGGSGGTRGGTGGAGAGAVGAQQGAATAGVTAGNCAGFTNSKPGIDDHTITVANAADLSGPVSGLFTSAQQAALAYAAYFNATSSICGRKVKVATYDSETSSVGDQQADIAACQSSFAMVGSVGAFDDGGVKTVNDCGIPDIRAIATTDARVHSAVTYGADSVAVNLVPTVHYEILKQLTGTAYQKAAMLYLNAGASVANALAYKKAMQHVGYDVVVTQPIDVTDINYAPYASLLKSKGVRFVQFEGTALYAVRLQQAMDQVGLHPAFVMDSVAYDSSFVAAAGGQLNGMYSYVDTKLFEEVARTPELQLYEQWLHRTSPSAVPSFFGVFAWGAMRLFTQLAVQLGGRLNRQTLLAALRDTHSFDSNGLFAPQDVGRRSTSPCQSVLQLENSQWVRRSPYPWSCGAIYDTG
jgi:ABC-type branched-subunit amino acid transport system substrate-binding protein